MTLAELIQKGSFEKIWKTLATDLENPESNKPRYQALLQDLAALAGQSVVTLDPPAYLVVSKLLPEAPPPQPVWDVCGFLPQTQEICDFMSLPWEDWLGLQLCPKSLDDFGMNATLACILDEMLMWGCGFSASVPDAEAEQPNEEADNETDAQPEVDDTNVGPPISLADFLKQEGITQKELQEIEEYADEADEQNEAILGSYFATCV